MAVPLPRSTARRQASTDCRLRQSATLSIADKVSGIKLLEAISETARKEGFKALLGPLDGDTWHAYRVVTESDGSMPFMMEPKSGPL